MLPQSQYRIKRNVIKGKTDDVSRNLPPAQVFAPNKNHVSSAQELPYGLASGTHRFHGGGPTTMPYTSFWRKCEPIAPLEKSYRPIQVFGVSPKLLVQQAHFAQRAATDQHRAACCLAYFLVLVVLSAVDLLPTPVLTGARPQTKVSACIPKQRWLVGKINLRANCCNAGITFNRR